MRHGGLIRVAMLDLRRSWRTLLAASAGVAFTVAALLFFLGLALGVRALLLGRVLPLDSIEVAAEAQNLDILALRLQIGSDTLDAERIDRLRELAGVKAVFPKMKLTVPAMASGGRALLGSTLQTELVADGIDPELVREEVGEAFRFDGVETAISCRSNRECPEKSYCSGLGLGGTGTCRNTVPVLISNHLIELYNGSFRRAYGLPQLNPDRAVGITFDMEFGASSLRAASPRGVIRERMRVAGISERAIPLGVTLPLDFVRGLNVRFGSTAAADTYHSAILQLADKRDAARVIEAIQTMDLVVTDRGARRVSTLMAVLLAVIGVIGIAMIGVAAVSVAHGFFVIVWTRRREIGLYRAIGATRGDVMSLFAAEAIAVGLVAGLAGVALGVGAMRLADRLARSTVPDFPFKPETFFVVAPWLAAAAVLTAVAACVLGAILPARGAAARDPAEVLTGH